MNQETRSLLAIGLSVAIFILWYSYFVPKPPQKTVEDIRPSTSSERTDRAQQPQDTNPQTTRPSDPQTPKPSDPHLNIPLKTTIIESDLYRVALSNDGGIPISWEMKKFPANGGAINLISEGDSALFFSDINGIFPNKPRFKTVSEEKDSVTFEWRSKELEIKKIYKFAPNGYLFDLSIRIKPLIGKALALRPAISWSKTEAKKEAGGFLSFLKGPQNIHQSVYFIDGKTSRDTALKEGKVLWAGIEDRYFISAVIPRGHGERAEILAKSDKELISKITTPSINIPANGETEFLYSVYAGPKEINMLKSVGVNLDKAIDYGWFSFVAVPILHLLKFFYNLIHNYGIAIILLTIFVKLILHPLTKHSMKSMKAMQVLQPKMKELREKYKNDKERLNMETMQLFKTHKVNPMGGCLPMLLQLPIYIALYKVLWNSIELYRAPFVWFYKDLSAPDPYFITPVLLGLFMWLQQKLTPSATADPAQAKMMQIMPIMFTAFMLFLPSGLVVYILVNTVFGVLQQWMMNHDIRFRDLVRGRLCSGRL